MYKGIADVIVNTAESFYVIFDHHAGEMTYGIVIDVLGNSEHHTCAYLNVDKAAYIAQVDEEFVREWDITFDNIPSSSISIPPAIRAQLTLEEKNYWIGIDSMGMGMRIHDSMASKLDEIYHDYNRRVNELGVTSAPDTAV